MNVRVGLLSLVTGKGEDAAAAFARAKELTNQKTVVASLDALIAAAKSGKGVIPDDVKGTGAGDKKAASPKEKVALVLSMGVVHLVAGRPDNAKAMFDRVLGTPAVPAKPGTPGQPARQSMQGAAPAQLAFAAFGRGAVLHARNKPEEAKELFLASIRAFGDGSWHDESLFRAASITQSEAPAKFGKAPDPAAKPGQPAKPLTPAENEAAARSETERLTALLKAKREALSYWQELIERYPRSPRVEQAMYNAAVLLCELAEAAPAAQSEKAWKDAAFMLSRFCVAYPKSPQAGDAYVRQMDIALERMFDLTLAAALAVSATDWGAAGISDTASTLASAREPWRMSPGRFLSRVSDGSRYALCLRTALIAYLQDRFDDSRAALALASGAVPPNSSDGQLWGMAVELLQDAARKQKAITPKDVLDEAKSDAQALAVKLGDLYQEALCPEKAAAVYRRVRSGEPPFKVVPGGIEAYCIMQEASALMRQDGRDIEVKALDVLRLLYNPKYSSYRWTSDGLLWMGTFTYNHTQDWQAALPHFQYVVTHYPKANEAPRALLYCCIAAIDAKDKKRAMECYERFVLQYPDSEWRFAADDLKKKIDVMKRTKGEQL